MARLCGLGSGDNLSLLHCVHVTGGTTAKSPGWQSRPLTQPEPPEGVGVILGPQKGGAEAPHRPVTLGGTPPFPVKQEH